MRRVWAADALDACVRERAKPSLPEPGAVRERLDQHVFECSGQLRTHVGVDRDEIDVSRLLAPKMA